jgi:hypothetical protein
MVSKDTLGSQKGLLEYSEGEKVYCIMKYMQSDPQVVNISVGDNFLFFVIKEVHINKCPILKGSGVATA